MLRRGLVTFLRLFYRGLRTNSGRASLTRRTLLQLPSEREIYFPQMRFVIAKRVILRISQAKLPCLLVASDETATLEYADHFHFVGVYDGSVRGLAALFEVLDHHGP